MSRVSLAGNFLNNNKTNFRNLVFDTSEMDCKLARFLLHVVYAHKQRNVS